MLFRSRRSGGAPQILGQRPVRQSFGQVQPADFVRAVGEGKPCSPTFREALETQYVCDAVLESARTHAWVKCKHS